MKFILVLGFTFASAVASASGLALVQYDANKHFADYAYNLRELTTFADQAVAHGSTVIVFPEGSLYGYADAKSFWCREHTSSKCRDVKAAAEAIPSGQSTSYWATYAKAHNIFVLFNLPEAESGQYFNTTAVVGPSGFVTKYRKRNLYYIDEYYADSGNLGPVSFTTPEGSYGLLICADANYENSFYDYRQQGQVIVAMDWDQDPHGGMGARPARTFFQQMAIQTGIDIFISDVSPWDGTGAYLHTATSRSRSGLAPVAIGQDGISFYP